jgi:hypothetical protein
MTRILLDTMCGGLRPYLRMCGHDTVYSLDRDVEADDELLRVAREEDRLLVTRDGDLAARAGSSLLLRSLDVEDQLRELLEAGIDLTLEDEPQYCGRCNGPLEPAESGDAPEYVPDPMPDRVWRCRDCGQYFWKATHWDDVAETLDSLTES